MSGPFLQSTDKYDNEFLLIKSETDAVIDSVKRLNRAKAEDFFTAFNQKFPNSKSFGKVIANHLSWETSNKAHVINWDSKRENPVYSHPIIFNEDNSVTVPVYVAFNHEDIYAGTITVSFKKPADKDVYSNHLVKAVLNQGIRPTLKDFELAMAEEALQKDLSAKFSISSNDTHMWNLCVSIEKAVKELTSSWKNSVSLLSDAQKDMRIKAFQLMKDILDPEKDLKKALIELKSLKKTIRSERDYRSNSLKLTFMLAGIISACMMAFLVPEGGATLTAITAIIGGVSAAIAWFVYNPAAPSIDKVIDAAPPSTPNAAKRFTRRPAPAQHYHYGQQCANQPLPFSPPPSYAEAMQASQFAPLQTVNYGYDAMSPTSGYDQHLYFPLTNAGNTQYYFDGSPPPYTPHLGSYGSVFMPQSGEEQNVVDTHENNPFVPKPNS